MPPARERLARQLRRWWREYVEVVGQDYLPPGSGPEFTNAITERDADGFLRGLNQIFRIERGYILQTELMPRRADGTLRRYVLFGKDGGRVGVRDESIVHLAGATELVVDYGWPKDQVMMESAARGAATQGALDIVVFRDSSHKVPAVIAGEAKASVSSVERMLAAMRRCQGVGPIGRGHPDYEHKKCIALLAYKAPLFLAIAAGYRALLPVEHEGDRFLLGERGIQLGAPGSA